MKYSVAAVSLGCPKNLVDTENMLGLLAEDGYEIISDAACADVIIVNTCGFIGDAKEESVNTILRLADYKQQGRLKALIVTGCLAERYKDEIIKEIPEVDAVCGTGDFVRICSVVRDALSEKKSVLYGNADNYDLENLPRFYPSLTSSAYIKIAEGCDNRCTYCVIPYLRGKYRSRRMEDVVAEAEALSKAGVREIILIAQDTSRYGVDIYGKKALSDLLKKLSEIEDIKWIRIHYLYPEAVDEKLLDVISKTDKVLNYFDIPIQHASNSVLKRMGRPTTYEKIEKLVSDIRRKMPDAVIRTSVIVGFPGETKEEFEELLNMVKKLRFDRLGAFMYSKEENTAAAKMKNQIPKRTKTARYNKIMKTQMQISSELCGENIGKIFTVLCEGYDDDNYMYFGRSFKDSIDIDGKVYFAAMRDVKIGEFVSVRALCSDEYDITGELVE